MQESGIFFYIPFPQAVEVVGHVLTCTYAVCRAAVESMAIYRLGFSDLQNQLLGLRKYCQREGNVGLPLTDHRSQFILKVSI